MVKTPFGITTSQPLSGQRVHTLTEQAGEDQDRLRSPPTELFRHLGKTKEGGGN